MKTELKSPENIEAQIAAYAQEGVKDTGYWKGNEHDEIFRNIGDLAAGPAVDHAYTVARQDILDTTRINTSKHILSADGYVNYLRRSGGRGHAAIENRRHYLAAYADFAPEIAPILADIKNVSKDERKQHDSTLGAGGNASAHGFEHGGDRYIVKIIHGVESNGAQAADKRLMALERGRDLHPRLEQLTAISYDDGVAIMERMSGTDLWQSSLETIAAITDTQLREALHIMRLAQDAGIQLDPKGSNYMYSPEDGFGFVDYGSMDEKHFETYAQKVQSFAEAISTMGMHVNVPVTCEDYMQQYAEAPYQIATLEHLWAICKGEPDQENYIPALAEIEKRITQARELMRNVETAGWVDEQVAQREQKLAAQQALRTFPASTSFSKLSDTV